MKTKTALYSLRFTKTHDSVQKKSRLQFSGVHLDIDLLSFTKGFSAQKTIVENKLSLHWLCRMIFTYYLLFPYL